MCLDKPMKEEFVPQGNFNNQLLSIIAVAAMVSLSGCGGGSDEPTTAAPATATTGTATADAAVSSVAVSADTNVKKKVLYIGTQDGFVAKGLATAMPAGSQAGYDVLVVGDVDKQDDSVLATVQQALANGKEVVFDGPSDGSSRITHSAILQKLVGTQIDAAAVRVEKAPAGSKGYYVTPIDAPAVAQVKTLAASAQGVKSPSNTVNTVFGIDASETAK